MNFKHFVDSYHFNRDLKRIKVKMKLPWAMCTDVVIVIIHTYFKNNLKVSIATPYLGRTHIIQLQLVEGSWMKFFEKRLVDCKIMKLDYFLYIYCTILSRSTFCNLLLVFFSLDFLIPFSGQPGNWLLNFSIVMIPNWTILYYLKHSTLQVKEHCHKKECRMLL